MEKYNSTIVSFANQKGGAGKTNITVLTANWLANEGKKICVIDADPQKTIIDANKLLGSNNLKFQFDLVKSNLVDITKSLNDVYERYDIIFIDMPGILADPGGKKDSIVDFLYITDVLFIPTKPKSYDTLSTIEFFKILKQIKELKNKKDIPFEFYFFINCLDQSSEAKELDNFFENNQMPRLNTDIPDYKDYERFGLSHMSLRDAKKSDGISNSKSIPIFTSFTDEVKTIINNFNKD